MQISFDDRDDVMPVTIFHQSDPVVTVTSIYFICETSVKFDYRTNKFFEPVVTRNFWRQTIFAIGRESNDVEGTFKRRI